MMRIVLFGSLFMSLSFAINYYVAPWGNDNYNGLSWDSAFVTLQRAADIVNDGDSVFAANGNYAGFDLRDGGSPSLPIVFKAFGDSVTIDTQNPVTQDGINVENADWVVVDGFRLVGLPRAGIRVALSEHVEIKNNFCDNNSRWGIFTGFADYAYIHHNVCQYSQIEHGIYFSNSADHPNISHNICHHNNANGIHMNGDLSMGGDGLITDATVHSNIIYENGVAGGSGINCDGVAQSRIFNNLLYMNHASGISLYQIDGAAGSYSNKVYNNTIINASNGRWCLNINNGSYGDTVYNNILYNLHSWRGSITIDNTSLPEFYSDHNIVLDRFSRDGGNSVITLAQWQAYGNDLHSQLAAPLDSIFVSYLTGDYHLCDGSQAVDSGTSAVVPIVTHDLDSLPRPQGGGFDIGAYEYNPVIVFEIEKNAEPGVSYLFSSGAGIVFKNLQIGDQIMIYDHAGRSVHKSSKINSCQYCWDTREIPPGIYFCIVMSEINFKLGTLKIIIIK